ncbi:MAG: tetraacyldisaccharide 4'-kinase [Alistipes sp.]
MMLKSILLVPIAFLYKLGVSFRHHLFDWGILKGEKFTIPIICIGNITVGGTGKTPMAEMIIGYMSQIHTVALLSRGYGRRTKGYLEVQHDSHYRMVGDEPLQIKHKFPETVVAVCEKRSEGIRRIQAEHPEVDLIIMDDGFQHRFVVPTINLVMIDATRPIQHDKMLPVGTLRDLPSQLYRAHYFVVTKCPEQMPPIDRRILRKVLIQIAYQRVYFTRFESFMPHPIFADKVTSKPVQQGQQVIALSGIGNPQQFMNGLAERYEVVASLELNDHHVYKVKDMEDLVALSQQYPRANIITTEKDAIKLTNRDKVPLELQRKLYYIPINISFIEDSATDFLQNLEKDVRGN